MKADLTQNLAEALQALERGDTLEPILAAHPESAAALGPLLETARQAQSLRADDIPPAAARRSRQRFLRQAASVPRSAHSLQRLAAALPRRLATALVILAAFLLGAAGFGQAAAQALPGDLLYPVKRAAEKMVLLLSTGDQRRFALEAAYAERRLDEVARLLALGRSVTLSFEGTVVRMGPVIWDVGGIPVRITPETRILGEIVPGMIVEVEGLTQADGTVLAHKLHLRQYDLLGRLNSLGDASVVVDGVTLRRSPATWIEPGLAVGELVLVRVAIGDAGERTALSIVRFEPGTPTRSPSTLTPTAGATPTPAEVDGGAGRELEDDDDDDDDDGDDDDDDDD